MIIYNYLTKSIFPDKEGKRSLSPFSFLAIGSAILAISAIGYLYLGKEKALPPPSTPPPTTETSPGDSDKKTFGLVLASDNTVSAIEIVSKNNSETELVTKMTRGTYALVYLTDHYAVRAIQNSKKLKNSLIIRKRLHNGTRKEGIQPLPEGRIEYWISGNTKIRISKNMRYEVTPRREGNLTECATRISKEEIPYLGKALIEAIEITFQKNVYHLDLKLENILYVGHGKIEIIDWEDALVIEEGTSSKNFAYAAKKIGEKELTNLQKHESHSLSWIAKRAIIRLFGIYLFELCSAAQKTPPDRYYANEPHEKQKENVKKTLLFAFNKNQTNFIAEEIMHSTPARRPDFPTIRDHLFEGIQ